MAASRTGVFWDVMEGRLPPPPAARTLGWKLLAIDPDAGTIRVQFEARPEFLNPNGVVQGGFLAAMLDDTMGPALAATLEADRVAPTLEFKVSFARPAKPGILIGEARVVHRGRSVAFLEGALRDAEGRLIATATATASIAALG